jgi:hypothetical protein
VIYALIRRNFDIVPSPLNQFQATSYVNGTLYSFFIYEDCGEGDDPTADAVEFPVDPLASVYTSVANPFNLTFGWYLTSLTRDDVAGLRYLIRSNNINLEEPGTTVEAFVTNAVSPVPLFTQDLGLLIAQSRTNDAAALEALYPGLITTATFAGFQLVTNTEVFFIIGPPPPFAPAYAASLVAVTNSTLAVVPTYVHTFGNVVTNFFAPHRLVTVEAAGFFGVMAPALLMGFEFSLSGYGKGFYYLSAIYLVVALIEATLTTAAVAYFRRVKPGILSLSRA